MMVTLISVVVPVYNEEWVLANCLEALVRQDYPGPYEIIVVDNASTDRSKEIACRYPVRVVSEPRKSYVYALRAGCAAARGELIAFTDADTVVPRDWLSRIARDLEAHPQAVAVAGFFRLYDCASWQRVLGSLLTHLSWHLSGGNMAVWRWAYEAVGGFNPNCNLGADVELGMRLQRYGPLLFDHRLIVSTSGRRLRKGTARALWMWLTNDLWLLLFHRPLYRDFPDVRLRPGLPPASSARGRLAWGFILILSLILVLVYAGISPNAQIYGKVYASGHVQEKVVALTFDDGPNVRFTEQVLDVLDQYGVRATFFVVGINAMRRPDLIRRMVSEGHVVGNHTCSHPDLAALEPPTLIGQQLLCTDAAIWQAAGVHPALFRPPHGYRSPWMLRRAHALGYLTVEWNDSADDWRRPPAEVIAQRVVKHARPGAIILLHDGLNTDASPDSSRTLAALPLIIQELEARGYRFVTVPELLGVPAYR